MSRQPATPALHRLKNALAELSDNLATHGTITDDALTENALFALQNLGPLPRFAPQGWLIPAEDVAFMERQVTESGAWADVRAMAHALDTAHTLEGCGPAGEGSGDFVLVADAAYREARDVLERAEGGELDTEALLGLLRHFVPVPLAPADFVLRVPKEATAPAAAPWGALWGAAGRIAAYRNNQPGFAYPDLPCTSPEIVSYALERARALREPRPAQDTALDFLCGYLADLPCAPGDAVMTAEEWREYLVTTEERA